MSKSAGSTLLTLAALLECAECNGVRIIMLERTVVIATALGTSEKLA